MRVISGVLLTWGYCRQYTLERKQERGEEKEKKNKKSVENNSKNKIKFINALLYIFLIIIYCKQMRGTVWHVRRRGIACRSVSATRPTRRTMVMVTRYICIYLNISGYPDDDDNGGPSSPAAAAPAHRIPRRVYSINIILFFFFFFSPVGGAAVYT